MTLAQLERAEQLIRLGRFLNCPLRETFQRSCESDAFYSLVQDLLDEQQFYTLLHLKRAEHHAQLALDSLSVDTEYLRPELEQQLVGLRVLFAKIEQEEHLRRDRAVLLASAPIDSSEGMLQWISGKTTG